MYLQLLHPDQHIDQQVQQEKTAIMAENKRQSIAGKIATPKLGPSKDVTDADSNLYKAVGARYDIIQFSRDYFFFFSPN